MASPVWGWRSHGNASRSLSLRLRAQGLQVTSCRSQKAAFANRTRPKGVLFAKAAFCKQIATRDLSGGCGRLRALASLRSVIMGPPPTPSRGRGEKNDEERRSPLRWRVLRPLPRSRSGRRQPHPRGRCLRAEGASSGGGCRLALLPLVRASRPLSSAPSGPNVCAPNVCPRP